MIPKWLKESIKQVMAGMQDDEKKAEIVADIKKIEEAGKLPPVVEPKIAVVEPVADIVTPAAVPVVEVKADEVKKDEKLVIAEPISTPVVEEIKKAIDPTVVEDVKASTRAEKVAAIVAKSKMKKKVKEIAKKIESHKRLTKIKAKLAEKKTEADKKPTGKEVLLAKLELRKKIKESLQRRALLAKLKEKRLALEAAKKKAPKRLADPAKRITPNASVDEKRKSILERIRSRRTVDTITSKLEKKLGIEKKK